jgi:hypothetical protein
MPVERRGRAIRVMINLVNWQQEEPNGCGGGRQPSMDGTSRVNREVYARFCERLGVKFPGPTRRLTGTWLTPTPRSASSSNVSTTSNGCTRLWAMCHRPSSSRTRGFVHEAAWRPNLHRGAPPPDPWDLSPWGQNGWFRRRPGPPPAIPAAESALGLRPRSALSSAQVLPEWKTSTPPCNTFPANGDYPPNSLSHARGSLHTRSHFGNWMNVESMR